jgi:OOP family OmpA-OmpF porin
VNTLSNIIRLVIAAMFVAACAQPEPAPKPAPPPPPPPPAAKPAPAPAPKPAPAPAAKPTPPKPIILRATLVFDSGKSDVDALGKFRLDEDIIKKLGAIGRLTNVDVNGHDDRLATPQNAQKISERRAASVKAYLVSKGMDASGITTYGYGKTLPVKSCPDTKDRRVLLVCLEPNRRVEVEVQGMPR